MDSTRIKLEEFHIVEEYDPSTLSKANQSKSFEGVIKIVIMDNLTMEIDFIGLHTSLVNAYRRIILAEVPTMAIEKVYMFNNTSIVQDEVLAHRIGLVPLSVDPRLFAFRSKDAKDWGSQDTVKFNLKVKCTKNPKIDPSTTANRDILYKNRKVLSSCLKWIPIGNQGDIFSEKTICPLHDDILLAKMNPGHEINLDAYAVKGIGSDHAKFQPGLAWYRMLPEIQLTREVEGSEAQLLQKCFSPGVISLTTNNEGKTIAKVNDARYDSCSRNVYQYDRIKDAVKLTRKTDHIIFCIESHSFLKSHEILEEAVSIMISKCDTLLTELNKYVEKDL